MTGRVMAAMLGCAVAVLAGQKASAQDLAPTPPMGWNSWNTFQTHIDEDLIKSTADTMIASGMRDAGYVYVNLDDGWSAKERDAGGNLVGDPQRFPDGMKALGDYLHAHGFKFGIYNCAGTETCAGYPGARGHEFQDAKTYASWGVDYLKFDWCHTEGLVAPEAYKKMHEALAASGRPIVFSICEWGNSKPWTWAKGIGQLWRTTGDISPCWDCKNKWSEGWKRILDQQVPLAQYAGPGHWNDPDMLEVGNKGLTPAEWRGHFSLWCILAAPLIAGNDVRNMTKETQDILTNHEVIAIDQDPLGKEGTRFRADADEEIWIKELSNGQWAVCLLNPTAASKQTKLNWKDLTFLNGRKYLVRDLWAQKDLGDTSTDFSGEIASHDVALFRLTPAK
ncbi:MAG TPA: glycoside hydrolase family 27 protein [Tepidisphaeraceae bacterium]|nr:glycoside hydrolase family 27 protein [Tepidisphaeraceae bacterium]